jgi:predicted  nucleic acid-binding Zn-ribbon protein
MAQIDMNKIKANTVNSDKVEELKTSEQPKADEQPVELIDNTSEKSEDNNEIGCETETEEAKETIAVVRYAGNGTWKDSTGLLWKCEDSHKYPINEYNERDDFKFMVGYGAMKVTFV